MVSGTGAGQRPPADARPAQAARPPTPQPPAWPRPGTVAAAEERGAVWPSTAAAGLVPAGRAAAPSARRWGGRAYQRRRLVLAAAGVLVLCLSMLAFGLLALRLDHRATVLATARDIPAGTVLTAADVRTVSVSEDPSLRLISAAEESTVVGQVAALPLPAGVPLTRSMLAGADFPPAGKAVVSLALKPGQFPEGLSAGATVAVYVPANAQTDGDSTQTGDGTPTADSSGASDRVIGTVVTASPAADSSGGAVLTVVVAQDAASLLATTAQTSLLVVRVPAGTK